MLQQVKSLSRYEGKWWRRQNDVGDDQKLAVNNRDQ